MLRKFENMIEQTQEEFQQAINKLEKSIQESGDQEHKIALLTDTQAQFLQHQDAGQPSDSQIQVAKKSQEANQQNQDQKQESKASKNVIQQAKSIIQADQLRQKDYQIRPNTQKIKQMLLNEIEKSSSQNKEGGNLSTFNSAQLPQSDFIIKFAQKEQYIEVYDVISLTRKKISTQIKFHDCSATFQIGLNLYVVGGQNPSSQQLQNNFYQISSSGDAFQLANINHRRGMLNLTGCKDYLIASGGCDYDDNPFNYVQWFKFTQMSWKDIPSLVSARFGHAACVVSTSSSSNSSNNNNHNTSVNSDKTSTSSDQNNSDNWEDDNGNNSGGVVVPSSSTFPVSSNHVAYVFCGAISSSTDTNNIERLKGGSSYWQVLNIFMPIHAGRYYLAKVIPNRSQILLMGGLDNKDMVFFSLECEPMEAKFGIKNAPDAAFNCPSVIWQNTLFTISDISDQHYELYKMNIDDQFQMLEVTDI